MLYTHWEEMKVLSVILLWGNYNYICTFIKKNSTRPGSVQEIKKNVGLVYFRRMPFCGGHPCTLQQVRRRSSSLISLCARWKPLKSVFRHSPGGRGRYGKVYPNWWPRKAHGGEIMFLAQLAEWSFVCLCGINFLKNCRITFFHVWCVASLGRHLYF